MATVEPAQQTTPFDDEPGAKPQATSQPAASQPEAAPEPETQQNTATSTAEPEVVANVGAQGADVAPRTLPRPRRPAAPRKRPRARQTPACRAREARPAG